MDTTTPRRSSIDALRQTRPAALPPDEQRVRRSFLQPDRHLPLVLQPTWGAVDLVDWIQQHRETLDRDLATYGGLLLRGFAIDSPQRFETVARMLCSDLDADNGEHNRESVSASVFTPTFYPQERKVLWHNENSFNLRWPRRILFCCQTPAEAGGETAIVDSRQVYRELPSRIRARFLADEVSYARNYGSGLGLSWQTVFGSDDKAVVEQRCRDNEMEFEWKSGDRLRTVCRRPAAIRHPVTGEPVWFNQALHWHVSMLDAATREALERSFAPDDLPRSCTYGTGAAIDDDVIEEVRRVYERLEVAFPWERGDVMLLDNVLTAHARNPYRGARKLLVATGDLASYHDVIGVIGEHEA
jgi:alpha-ketoglutarate-dependent taurine dioxygenase